LNSKISIRKAKIEDVSAIMTFIRELAEYEKLSMEVISDEKLLSDSLFSDQKTSEAIIAEYDNIKVGFALFFHTFSTFLGKPGLYLEDLYVRPDMRGKGCGKALFKKVAQLAVERNCGRLEWSVLNWNKPAIDFYKANGAKPMDEWTVYRLSNKKLSSFSKKNEKN
tara:strand:+ start:1053 stop:1550 length:498 start_codon:yes stop_codon:yes gene_type:complete